MPIERELLKAVSEEELTRNRGFICNSERPSLFGLTAIESTMQPAGNAAQRAFAKSLEHAYQRLNKIASYSGRRAHFQCPAD